MHQKPGDELLWRKPHGFLFVLVGPVQVSEGNSILINILDAVIANRNFMRISRQIFDHRIRVFKRLFSMHHPVGLIEFFLQLPEVVYCFR